MPLDRGGPKGWHIALALALLAASVAFTFWCGTL
jgi:hypothetical protein